MSGCPEALIFWGCRWHLHPDRRNYRHYKAASGVRTEFSMRAFTKRDARGRYTPQAQWGAHGRGDGSCIIIHLAMSCSLSQIGTCSPSIAQSLLSME